MNKKFPPKKEDTSYLIKPAPKLEWSSYQKALFKDIAQGEGHTIVEAYAGASKTTSIVESFKYIPRGKKAIALAFNKIIQEELRSRSPSYVDVLTFHSLGYRAIKQKFGNVVLILPNPLHIKIHWHARLLNAFLHSYRLTAIFKSTLDSV